MPQQKVGVGGRGKKEGRGKKGRKKDEGRKEERKEEMKELEVKSSLRLPRRTNLGCSQCTEILHVTFGTQEHRV